MPNSLLEDVDPLDSLLYLVMSISFYAKCLPIEGMLIAFDSSWGIQQEVKPNAIVG